MPQVMNLIPFGLFGKTAFLAERVLGNVGRVGRGVFTLGLSQNRA